MDEDDDAGNTLNRIMDELSTVEYHRENKSTHDVVISKESFHPGDEIYSSYPYAAALIPGRSSQICSYCFKQTKLMRCSRCRTTKYCSRTCQARDWQHHKVVCGLNSSDVLMHLLLRIVLLLVGSDTMTPLNFKECRDMYRKQFKVESFLDLQEVLNRDPNVAPIELYRKCQFQNTLEQLLSEIAPKIIEQSDTMLRERGFSDEFIRGLQNSTECSSRASEYCLIRLLRKQCVNVVPIRDRMLEIIGYGIFPTLSPIQRSCDPNCVVVFDKLCAKLIAIRPILPKDHLTVSFISTRHSYPVRDDFFALYGSYICDCPRCTLQSEELKKKEKEAFSIKCPETFNGVSCSGVCFPILSFPGVYPFEYSCSICHKSFNSLESMDEYSFFQCFEGLQSHIDENPNEINTNQLKKYVAQLDKFYPSRNPELLISRVLLLQCYISSENYQAAVELGEFILPVAVDVFGKSLELMAFYSLLISAYDGVFLSAKAKEFELRCSELADFFKVPL